MSETPLNVSDSNWVQISGIMFVSRRRHHCHNGNRVEVVCAIRCHPDSCITKFSVSGGQVIFFDNLSLIRHLCSIFEQTDFGTPFVIRTCRRVYLSTQD
jgi:hypothetical protein